MEIKAGEPNGVYRFFDLIHFSFIRKKKIKYFRNELPRFLLVFFLVLPIFMVLL